MILVPGDIDKSTEASPSKTVSVKEKEQPPPAYDDDASESMSSPPVSAGAAASNNNNNDNNCYHNAVNYISISRLHGHIKETLIVDPSLYIPPSLRPPAPSPSLLDKETEEAPKNVRLESVHGRVQADITLVSRRSEKTRATIALSSVHGGIKAKIHDRPDRPAFSLSAKSQNGSIKLALPSSFQGPISISYRHGQIKHSASLEKRLVTFSERDGVARCFLGGSMMSRYVERERREGMGGWDGDEVSVEVTHGNLKLEYDDDERAAADLEDGSEGRVATKQPLMKRLLGLA